MADQPASSSSPAVSQSVPSASATNPVSGSQDVGKASGGSSYFSGLKAFTWGGTPAKDSSPQSTTSREPKLPPNASLDELAEQPLPEKSGASGADHRVSHWHGLNPKSYPPGCPPLTVHWFHAVDVPKRKPFNNAPTPTDKVPPAPKKYTPFSDDDSIVLEAAFQRIADEQERQISSSKTLPSDPNRVRVPVNEDYLFDVDIQNRELAPAYWLGPTYDVRRGTWFTLDGSNLRPCEESLAVQLEDGYLRIKPWLWTKNTIATQNGVERIKSRPHSRMGDDSKSRDEPVPFSTGPASGDSIGPISGTTTQSGLPGTDSVQNTQSINLFGEYTNLLVAYQDDKTAWVTTNDFISRMGGFLTGYKVIRGYKNPTATPSPKPQSKSRTVSTASANIQVSTSHPPGGSPQASEEEDDPMTPAQIRFQALQRQISNLNQQETAEQKEENIRQRDEEEIVDDYQRQTSEERGRQIDHLILVTHGIGQRLGLRLDRVNFVHDVNTLRKTLKAVYSGSSDLQALNEELDKDTKNSRVQVLPVCWRHLLDFPRSTLRDKAAQDRAKRGREHDLGDVPPDVLDERDDAHADAESFPSLDDITIEGIMPFRNFLTDLGLDVLLYQNEQYRAEIVRIVTQECNRVHALFLERNPSFRGRVSLIGHSLGSAIMFDILCAQKDGKPEYNQALAFRPCRASSSARRHRSEQPSQPDERLQLNFEVEHFVSLGSPIGLFHLLKGNKIVSRSSRRMRFYSAASNTEVPFIEETRLRSQSTLSVPDFTAFSSEAELPSPVDDPLGPGSDRSGPFAQQGLTRPKLAGDIYNIFYPSDPIAYRLEPLVSPAMATLKPQPLPYTKKGLFSANGAASQGLTNLGARVGQSVSGLWSSFSSGIANSLLNRHLGIDSSATTASGAMTPPPTHQTPGNATSTVGPDNLPGAVPPSVNPKLETLYASFRKKNTPSPSHAQHSSFSITGMLTSGIGSSSPAPASTVERESRRLRREEAKVRSLNRNGRLDFAIQEGTFDNISFSFLSSLASHLLYWADDDVAHFVIAQLLTGGGRRSGTGGDSVSGSGLGPGPSSRSGSPACDVPSTPAVSSTTQPATTASAGAASMSETPVTPDIPNFLSAPRAAAVMKTPNTHPGNTASPIRSSTQLRLSRHERKRIFAPDDGFGSGDLGGGRSI